MEQNGIFRKIFKTFSYIIYSTQSVLLFYFSELSSLLVMDAWRSQLQLKFQHSKDVTDGWIFLNGLSLICPQLEEKLKEKVDKPLMERINLTGEMDTFST